MAYELVRTKSLPAAATFTSKQYTFVKIDTAGRIATPSNGGRAIGIIQDKPAALDDPGAVCFPGDISKLLLGGSVSAGQELMTDGNGKGVAATSGSYVSAVALAAGSSGGIIPVIYQEKASKL